MIRVIMEGGGNQGQCNIFPGICLTTEENPKKPQLGNCRRALNCMTSHCFKWGPFPSNEVVKAMLPAPLAKSIKPSQKSVLKNMRSIDLGSAPPGHSLKIEVLSLLSSISVWEWYIVDTLNFSHHNDISLFMVDIY